MSAYSLSISKGNKFLNLLCNKVEIVGTFLLFIGLFDAQLFTWGNIFKVASYGILLFLLILRWKRCIYVATRNISLLLLIGFVMLSYFWSAAPEYTLEESKTVTRATLFGVYLAAQYNPKELMQLSIRMFGLAVVLNYIFIGFVIAIGQPSLAITNTNGEPSWQGFLTHKQYLGRMMMHATLLLLLNALSYKKLLSIRWVGFSLSAVLLLLSKSKTSWFGFLTALILLPLLKFVKWHYKSRIIIYIVFVLIAGISAVTLLGNYENILVNVFQKSPDLSGRFDVWKLAIESGLKRPWFGYGYSGFWTSNEGLLIVQNTWAVSSTGLNVRFHAHNGFIDLFLQLGIIGFSLFIFNFFTTVIRLVELMHLSKTVESFWMLEFLIISFLMQATETLTLISLHTICAFYVSIVLSTSIWQDRVKRNIAYF